MKRLLLIVLLIALSGTVFAEKSANDILPGCRPGGEMNFERAYCFGIVNGIFIAAAISESLCLPDSLTTSEALYIIFAAADNHPDKLHIQFSGFAYAALSEAHACPKEGVSL